VCLSEYFKSITALFLSWKSGNARLQILERPRVLRELGIPLGFGMFRFQHGSISKIFPIK
jgi:hypothetical protein